MSWFDTYVSNTLGGTGNQFFFGTEGARTGRIYYRIFAGGRYRYSLLFSNVIDSTYEAGDRSRCNLPCGEWEILRACVGICRRTGMTQAEEPERTFPLTFGGQRGRRVLRGESFFTTDPVELEAEKDEYLCLEIEYAGKMIPYHPEHILPSFVRRDGKWIPEKEIPVPGMVGCDRPVRARIGYFGDSITQGIGTAPNAYAHWNALVSEALGEAYAWWNLGIGYGRAQDGASDGAWLYKARQTDGVVLTFGTNDVGCGRSAAQIKADLAFILEKLQEAGVRVFLQTLPPFDWKGEALETWKSVNSWLTEELSKKADGFLDVVPILEDASKGCGASGYGGHPNEAGGRAWAEALLPKLREFAEKLS